MPLTIEMIEKYYKESIRGRTLKNRESMAKYISGEFRVFSEEYYREHPLTNVDTLITSDTDVRPVINWLISVVEIFKENPPRRLKFSDRRLFRYWNEICSLALKYLLDDIYAFELFLDEEGLSVYVNYLDERKNGDSPGRWIGSFEAIVTLANLIDRFAWSIDNYPIRADRMYANISSHGIEDLIILLEKKLTEWNDQYSPSSENYDAKTKKQIFELLLDDIANITYSKSLDTLAESEIPDMFLPNDLEDEIFGFYLSPTEKAANSYSRKLRKISSTFFNEYQD